MTDYRSMFDRDYVGAFELGGKDVVVEIAKVEAAELKIEGNKTKKSPVLTFRGAAKKLVCNKTNAKTLAGLFGNETQAWVGKKIAIYPTTTKLGRDTVDCIRIRNKRIEASAERDEPRDQPPAPREPGDEA